MDSSPTSRRSGVLARMCLPLAFLLIFGSTIQVGDAADQTVFEGIVGGVSGTHITVSGRDFDIGGARIINPGGKELPFSEVARGREVHLISRNGRIGAVVVYSADRME